MIQVFSMKILAAKNSKMHMILTVNLRATMTTLTVLVKKRIEKLW